MCRVFRLLCVRYIISVCNAVYRTWRYVKACSKCNHTNTHTRTHSQCQHSRAGYCAQPVIETRTYVNGINQQTLIFSSAYLFKTQIYYTHSRTTSYFLLTILKLTHTHINPLHRFPTLAPLPTPKIQTLSFLCTDLCALETITPGKPVNIIIFTRNQYTSQS